MIQNIVTINIFSKKSGLGRIITIVNRQVETDIWVYFHGKFHI